MKSNTQKSANLAIELTDAEISAASGGETSLSPEQQAAIKYKFRELSLSDVLRYINKH